MWKVEDVLIMIQMMNRKEIPVVPARGGAEVALDLMIRPFSYRTCVRHAPCVSALCELVVLLLPENVTGVRPRWHATASEHFLHTSRCTLHTMHFTLHTCTPHSTVHLISNHLISSHVTSSDLFSSHPIPSHMSSKQVLLNCFHLIGALKKIHLNSSQLFCTRESSCC